MSKRQDDLFEELFDLEDTFYNEGYDMGMIDGSQAGLVEGRLFGLEKGFEKYKSMGKLYGRAAVWAGRLPTKGTKIRLQDHVGAKLSKKGETKILDSGSRSNIGSPSLAKHPSPVPANKILGIHILPIIPDNARLEKHVRTLCALAEASSLSTENTEIAVSDFDDRLKRATGKLKMIEKITDEYCQRDIHQETTSDYNFALKNNQITGDDGSIEDINSLTARN